MSLGRLVDFDRRRRLLAVITALRRVTVLNCKPIRGVERTKAIARSKGSEAFAARDRLDDESRSSACRLPRTATAVADVVLDARRAAPGRGAQVPPAGEFHGSVQITA
jgi:hypothetical protein